MSKKDIKYFIWGVILIVLLLVCVNNLSNSVEKYVEDGGLRKDIVTIGKELKGIKEEIDE